VVTRAESFRSTSDIEIKVPAHAGNPGIHARKTPSQGSIQAVCAQRSRPLPARVSSPRGRRIAVSSKDRAHPALDWALSELVRFWCVKRRARILAMKRRRRLRRLVPDAELIRRRAAGEPLRELASDYDVAHTTLGRYFERPEVRRELKQASEQLRAAQRAAAARRSAERRQEQELRRKAREPGRGRSRAGAPRCRARDHFPPTPCPQRPRGLARRA